MVGKPLAYDRVYAAIKHAIMTGGLWPGERIDHARLKALVGTSHIRIREALRRLSAEGLVQAERREGFSVPYVTEAGLSGLYRWCHHSMLFPARTGTPPRPELVAQIDFTALRAMPIAEATSRFFLAVAIAADNIDAELATRHANDRLHLVRTLKEPFVPDSTAELDTLIDLWLKGAIPEFENGLNVYFQRRLDLVPQIVRLLHRRPTFI
ncbi:GntR family transcriptional regulator [Asticcacaulis sp. BYS171W]|uniref:GntR family transcriptional regulator n=1 Tax=Asticcacaulis aquaticus TaxID=2984212 RepID=A0ABT5HZ88_9CAUL|nr:GntR family transcriptional regulator [Asticcacaulis aquaticus]MDC7685314.1 GntR family transcriptional regulator [Asticcacaulis aquaticus]